MLSENQITSIWERRIAAEVRSFYFGELASRYATKKQWITFATLFLASGAAGTVAAKLPSWVPILLASAAAVITAYTVAVNLDTTIRSMAKFQSGWSELALAYENLWDHVHDDDAELKYESYARRERELGETASTDAPYNQKRLAYWQDHVFKLHNLVSS